MANWWWKADYIETCNCAYGCPCNLNMIPTDGTCQAIDAWWIKEGSYGEVQLNGLGIALLVRWPNPIHHGNGIAFIANLVHKRERSFYQKMIWVGGF